METAVYNNSPLKPGDFGILASFEAADFVEIRNIFFRLRGLSLEKVLLFKQVIFSFVAINIQLVCFAH